MPASSSPIPSQSTSTHSAVSSSSPLLPDIDVTTISSEPSRTDESLKVLPLDLANKTVLSNDKDDSTTVTSSTESPMTVNLSKAKIKPQTISNLSVGLTMSKEGLVNDEKDNQANQPQPELVVGEMDGKSRLNQEKEGRAINFPMGITSNNQSSTAPDHMQGSINFVTTSTEKTHVISFFDLSDVNMENDDAVNEQREMEVKETKTTTEKQTTELTECSHNSSMYKASYIQTTISNRTTQSKFNDSIMFSREELGVRCCLHYLTIHAEHIFNHR